MEITLSFNESVILSLSKCLNPYSHLYPMGEMDFSNTERVGIQLSSFIIECSKEFDMHLGKVSTIDNCAFCDITNREKVKCINLKTVVNICADPRVKIFTTEDFEDLKALKRSTERICISCSKRILFNKNPKQSFHMVFNERIPKIIVEEDISRQFFMDEEVSFYYESFCDDV
ncbi:TPA_asm: protein 3 [Erysimum virus 1]|uniref:Protein 3 n=1 Tax=Erysimum virus 1 TaxID=2977967 RepID=A0A9N6YJE2_9RHAB|nr:TPA_asm: protein 3 [Erysimum virus 1]